LEERFGDYISLKMEGADLSETLMPNYRTTLMP
jgi:hypothetical protein